MASEASTARGGKVTRAAWIRRQEEKPAVARVFVATAAYAGQPFFLPQHILKICSWGGCSSGGPSTSAASRHVSRPNCTETNVVVASDIDSSTGPSGRGLPLAAFARTKSQWSHYLTILLRLMYSIISDAASSPVNYPKVSAVSQLELGPKRRCNIRDLTKELAMITEGRGWIAGNVVTKPLINPLTAAAAAVAAATSSGNAAPAAITAMVIAT